MGKQISAGQQRVTLLAVGVVAVVAATVSYAHMYEVAKFAGEQWRALFLPLSVDGLVVAASLSAWQAKRRGEPVPPMTKVSLSAGLVVSVAANVLVPFLGELDGRQTAVLSALVAAWPAFALALAFEQWLKLRGTAADEAAEPAARVPERAAQPSTVVPETVPVEWTSLPQQDQKAAEAHGPVPLRHGVDQGRAAGSAAAPPEMSGSGTAAQVRAGGAARVPERAAEQTAALPVVADESARDDRAAARELVRSDPAAAWTGAGLGERFGKRERWGREQLKAARDEIEAARRPRLVAVDE